MDMEGILSFDLFILYYYIIYLYIIWESLIYIVLFSPRPQQSSPKISSGPYLIQNFELHFLTLFT